MKPRALIAEKEFMYQVGVQSVFIAGGPNVFELEMSTISVGCIVFWEKIHNHEMGLFAACSSSSKSNLIKGGEISCGTKQ